MKYQCYYNETIKCNNKEYMGKRVNTKCFNTEEEAEKYCSSHTGIQKYPNGNYEENEMNYDEIDI